jgi:hypothetical protein
MPAGPAETNRRTSSAKWPYAHWRSLLPAERLMPMNGPLPLFVPTNAAAASLSEGAA